MWRLMNSHPVDRPFGVVTESGKSVIARCVNGRIMYEGECITKAHKWDKARRDPPMMWWSGPLPILPKDVQEVLRMQNPSLGASVVIENSTAR